MNKEKTIGPLTAPILGTLPLVAFLLINYIFSFSIALVVGLGVYVVFLLVLRFYFKQKPSDVLRLTVVIFGLFALVYLPRPIRILYTECPGILFELCIVAVFAIFNSMRTFKRRRLQTLDDVTREFKIIRFDFTIYVVRIFLLILIFHLLIVLVYQLLPDKHHSLVVGKFIYSTLLFILLGIYYLYEVFHAYQIKQVFKSENWLPIVTETGAVRGKIAESVSNEMGNTYLHPIVRIALIYKGKLYLKNRNDGEGLDYPFESKIAFEETLESAVDRAFSENGGDKDLPSHFIFRYIMKNDKVNRLVYLYTCTIRDEETAQKLQLHSGKWWTSRQIEENRNTGIFSEYFEKEYDLLDNTVLLVDRIYGDLGS